MKARAVVLAVLVPLLAAGPVRAVTHLGIWWSLALCVLLLAPPILLLVRAPWSRLEYLAVVPSLVASWLLYNRWFHGLPHTGNAEGQGIDASVHVYNTWLFVRSTPEVYDNFVSLYGFWAVLQAIGGRIFAWNASYQLTAWVVAATPCVITLRLLRGRPLRAQLVGAVACLAASLVGLYWVVLPLMAVHHASGFWPHLFALIPMCGLWAVDALEERRWLRLGALFLLVALLRYTYGLNLPDVLLMLAAICVLEAGERVPLAARLLLLLAAAALAVAAHHAFGILLTVVGTQGWVMRHDSAQARLGQLTGVAALLVAVWWWPARRQQSADIVRALRVPILFAAVNAALGQLIGRIPNPTDYYHQKYGLYGVVLVTSGLVVAIGFCAAACSRMDWAPLIGLVVVGLCAGAGVRQLHGAFASYDPIFQDVAFGKPVMYRIGPWFDAGALQGIERKLAASPGKKFGGYKHRGWAITMFTSSVFGGGDNVFRAYQTLDTSPGHCVFWEEGSFPELDSFAKKDCQRYRNRQEPTVVRGVCARCD